jgi:hypothetical protein
VLRLPRPERRRQVDDDPAAARPDPSYERERHGARARQPAEQRSDPAPDRLPTRGPPHVRADDRVRAARVLRPPPRRSRAGASRRPRAAIRARARSPDPLALTRQQAEGRPRPGVRFAPRAARARRADVRPRPARPADVPRARPRDGRRGTDRLPLVARAVGGPARRRPRRDHPGGPARRGRGRRSPARPGDARARGAVRRAGCARRPRAGRRCAPGRPGGGLWRACSSRARWTRS